MSARKTERRTQQSAESRRRILEAAAEIAAERGYEGTSIALVTQRSGLPASSLYWHFGSKDELLAEVIEHSYREWAAKIPAWEPPADGAGDRRERLRSILRQAGRAMVDRPEFMRLGLMLMLERRAVEPAARARFLALRQEVLKAMGEWWTAALPPGACAARPALPSQLARLTMAAADGLYAANGTDVDPADIDGLHELLALALDGAAAAVERQESGEG
ncbi:TetR family transcriptional regulator [Streptomyces carminius]|uniref:TetR family transcriptional regulator n=1 Tax=Streptomyces carminius TaxID=2665496 RepID=A0A2M8LTV0_9ACTN|nr:TetR/AcrR family transcriptional regulator [Streptomyces carminius]PJE95383.1 TetR family transcriptional regulator [Streptomyces carminius]